MKFSFFKKIGSVLLIMIFHTTCIFADEIILDNGDRLSGKIVMMEENILKIETSYAGEISVDWARISGISTDTEIAVLLNDETLLKGAPQKAEEKRMRMAMGKIVETVSFDLSDVKAINPPPPVVKPALEIKGQLNAGLSATSGNTETQSHHFEGEFVARTEKNRYTAGGEFNRNEDDGRQTANNVLGYLKYDHFFSKKWYMYNNILFEKDRFKDLNLRTALGLGGGYQFFEGADKNLSVEAGITYINEDFEAIADDDYLSGRWSLNYDRYLYKKIVQFFHFHEGFVGFEDTNDIFIRSRTGIRIPVYKNFNATFQYNYDWDKAPSPGREKTDKGYLFTLGYSFGKD